MQIFSVVYSSERKWIHKKLKMDRRKTLKSNNIKYRKIVIPYFFDNVVYKNETVIVILEIRTYH
jgi:hypothetical protein